MFFYSYFPSATNQFSAALNFYLQAGAVSSDFFNKQVPPDVYTDQVGYLYRYYNITLSFWDTVCKPKELLNTFVNLCSKLTTLAHSLDVAHCNTETTEDIERPCLGYDSACECSILYIGRCSQCVILLPGVVVFV